MDLPHLQYTKTEPNIIARSVEKSLKYLKYFKSVAFPENLFHKSCSIWTIFDRGHKTGKTPAQTVKMWLRSQNTRYQVVSSLWESKEKIQNIILVLWGP